MTQEPLTQTLGIYLEAKKMLDFTAAAAGSYFVALPEQRYVTVGQAIHLCEQVVVEMTALQTGLPADTTPGGSAVQACPPPWSLVATVSIVRCGPEIQADGSTLATHYDAFAKIQSLDALVLQTAINSRVEERFGAVVASITFPPPSGGFVVTQARVVVAVTQ